MNSSLHAVLGLFGIVFIFQASVVLSQADFAQDFSSNTNSWDCLGCGTVTPTTFGAATVGLVPPICNTDFSGQCSSFGTPVIMTTWTANNTFNYADWVRGGFETSIDVWLDPLEAPTINANGVQLVWAVAANDGSLAGTVGRSYVLSVGKYSNSNCVLWPNCLVFGTSYQDDLDASSPTPDPASSFFPQEAGETGWYTFKHTFIEKNKYQFPVNDTLKVRIEVITPSGRKIAPPQWTFNTTIYTEDSIGAAYHGYFVLNLDADGTYIDNAEITYPGTCVPCDDNWDCTYDYFEERNRPSCPHKCVFLPLDSRCDDNDPCTTDRCDPLMPYLTVDASGCVHEPIECDDQNHCTDDACVSGNCTHTPISCDDGNPCTVDTCSEDVIGGCVNLPDDTLCVSANACEVGVCDIASGGCVYVDKVCDDGIYCTEDLCDTTLGCYTFANDSLCNDDIGCTEDICNEGLGECTNIPYDNLCVDDGNLCTLEYCAPFSGGCLTRDKVCDDDIACTDDTCVPGTGACVFTANHTHCDDGIFCTVDTCNADFGECTNLPDDSVCEEGNLCTTNVCDPVNGDAQGCKISHTKSCLTEGFDQIGCTTQVCNAATGNCDVSAVYDCDDDITCTVDSCDMDLGVCVHEADDSLCPVLDKCFTYECEIGYPGGCRPTPIECDDEVWCTNNWCDNGNCHYSVEHSMCDDGIACTDDECTLYTELNEGDSKNSGGCTNIPNAAHCDDGVACTFDECVPSLNANNSCVHTPEDALCDDNNACTLDRCEFNSLSGKFGCKNYIDHALCDDGIHCTLDYCDASRGCVHVPNDNWCDDSLACSRDKCNPLIGCTYYAQDDLCDDSIACTEDFCDLETLTCNHTVRHDWCDDNIGCTIDSCDASVGCSNVPCNSFCSDGRDCSVGTCSIAEQGCVLDDSACPQVTAEHCINCKSKSRIAEVDYQDGSRDLELKTRSEYSLPNTVASNVFGLETNVVVKGSGQVLVGMNGGEELYSLSDEDGLVVQNFRLSPSETRPICTETRRGTITVMPVDNEDDDTTDRLFVCVRTVLGYEWKLVDLHL